ncbi:activating signal cointegrator 1 isoform X2 [Amborella trichopoda]|uniref:Uncharacterized protein n=1 Tax=Amborella trichopoda TaxID=13333 RepID=W1PU39_AMBTC|nr:activating signal cointegrator 1 isoform X1 [Amborella trichopoda]XP_020526201.1 activating signal cointegrator 1 isoform X2 [Amborella trichopoda]ERN11349.1 hypothetical protein AMTR_s00024p00252130 [Amborella trichopoda]|eukprot:XP_006849768.1 activating signal cointegrator 1 isoform X1 [Amborella trichopoda]
MGCSETTGSWLESALLQLRSSGSGNGAGIEIDDEVISGLVSYCERAPPQDAKEFLTNIITQKAGQYVINEYLQRRGYVDVDEGSPHASSSNFHTYVKPPVDEHSISGTRRPVKHPKEGTPPTQPNAKNHSAAAPVMNTQIPNIPKKKKGGKVISLAEAAKGSIVFQQGKPCSCQARRHNLVGNCLSCGKIVCEQEGEGPCSFCGALVLREGSTYAGLDDAPVPLSEAEVLAEAFTKRLVDYDRNSAARTAVIDDQSDYYEIEGNSWLSAEDKALLQKKQRETEDAERARRNKLVVTFDLVGRKVVMNENEASELESQHFILRPAITPEEREANRIMPNPSIRVCPEYVDPGPSARVKPSTTQRGTLCLDISGRVQYDYSIKLPSSDSYSATSDGDNGL